MKKYLDLLAMFIVFIAAAILAAVVIVMCYTIARAFPPFGIGLVAAPILIWSIVRVTK